MAGMTITQKGIISALVLLPLCIAVGAYAQGGPQMPHNAASTSVPAEHVELLKTTFGRAGMQTDAAEQADVQAALLASLPGSVRAACRRMVEQWGEDARRSERLSVRFLHRERTLQRAEVLLAVRCGSTLEIHADDYDERLAILTLEGEYGRLKMFPFEQECALCSELYRLERGEVMLVEGKPYSSRLVEVKAAWSNDNPALGVVEHRRGVRLYLVVMPEARLVLAADLERETRAHDDQAGDSESKCTAGVDYVRDAVRRVTDVVLSGACPEDRNAPPSALRYRWNLANRALEPQLAPAY